MSESEELDIINIDKNEFKNELRANSLYIFYKTLTFISYLFIIFGFIGIFIGKLMLNLVVNIEYWSLLNTSFILNISMITIFFGFYGVFIFEFYVLRPIFFSIYFWWTIISLLIFIIFTLIIINWKYFNLNIYYLIFIPIYFLYFYFIWNIYKIYLICKYLSIRINNNNNNDYLIEKYSISHISIGILINIFLIFLYFIINKLSIIQCEFISEKDLKISLHFTLICQSTNYFIINNNNQNYNYFYNNYGKQEIIGLIWIFCTIFVLFLSIISFYILWKKHNYYLSIICNVLCLILSFISCLIWNIFNNICNDQTCINYNKYHYYDHGQYDLLITKHIFFLNSTTILIISCLMWCIIIWITINTINFRYKYKYKYIPL